VPVIVMPVITVPVVTPSRLYCRRRMVGHIDLHAGASGLQLHQPSGSTAITLVAVAMRRASVSNTVINLIIVGPP
jgi:hypothetical protein